MIRKMQQCFVAFVCCAFSSIAVSAYGEMVSTVEELTNALNQVSTAKTNAVITIAANVYKLGSISKMHDWAMLSVSNGNWGRKITIQGDPEQSRDKIVLDAEQAGRVLRIFGYSGSTTTLKNLTIRNALTSSSHGGVKTEEYGAVRFENCVFEGNHAQNGGAAAGGATDEYYIDCLFSCNRLGGGWGSSGVIDAPKSVSGCRFVGNEIYGDQIKGGCVKASCMITNCVFDSNCNTGRWGEATAVYLTDSGSCVDCTFTNNYWGSSTTKGGAVVLSGSASVVECRFYDNTGSLVAGGAISYIKSDTPPGKIESCIFAGNKTSGTANGGAVANFPGMITNCTFIGNTGYYGGAVYACSNVIDCVFACNTAGSKTASQNGGAGYLSVFFDCVITNNVGQEMSGSFSSCSVYRSLVGGASVLNLQTNRTVEADNTYFEDCELFGLEIFGVGFNNCGFNRCLIRDNILSNGYGYLIAGNIAVTNSLLLRNTAYRMFHDYQEGFDNNIVNCTFVSNTYDILAHAFTNGNPSLRVVNNLFVDTKTRTWSADDDVGEFYKGSVYSNNFISTTQNIVGYGNLNVKENSRLKPSLMLTRDPMHPFTPRRHSVLNGAGIVEEWMRTATDFAGNPRLTDGRVTIGAYEANNYYKGTQIIFR